MNKNCVATQATSTPICTTLQWTCVALGHRPYSHAQKNGCRLSMAARVSWHVRRKLLAVSPRPTQQHKATIGKHQWKSVMQHQTAAVHAKLWSRGQCRVPRMNIVLTAQVLGVSLDDAQILLVDKWRVPPVHDASAYYAIRNTQSHPATRIDLSSLFAPGRYTTISQPIRCATRCRASCTCAGFLMCCARLAPKSNCHRVPAAGADAEA